MRLLKNNNFLTRVDRILLEDVSIKLFVSIALHYQGVFQLRATGEEPGFKKGIFEIRYQSKLRYRGIVV